jgi:F-type H+-transporting ATPase subunit b
MLIDWFTVGAQALNFIILVWLLKRFLYKPILNAIDAREKRIAAELSDADAKRTEAQRQRDEFEHKNQELDRQRDALLNKATEDARTERHRLLESARQEADDLSAKRQQALQSAANALNQAIARQIQQEVFSIVRKALADLAETSLEERMSEVFIRRLHTVDSNTRERLRDSLKTSGEPVLVRSAFELAAPQREAIQRALSEMSSVDVHLRFETAADLVSGIELTTKGQKIAWSIADYLASLEKGVVELLKEMDTAARKPAGPRPEAMRSNDHRA